MAHQVKHGAVLPAVPQLDAVRLERLPDGHAVWQCAVTLHAALGLPGASTPVAPVSPVRIHGQKLYPVVVAHKRWLSGSLLFLQHMPIAREFSARQSKRIARFAQAHHQCVEHTAPDK